MPKNLNSIFPNLSQIPKEYKIKPQHINSFLVNGELIKSQGSKTQVISPIFLEKNGSSKPLTICSYSSLTVPEAFTALKGAKKAYNRGRGSWPTMTIEQRIEFVQKFVTKMQEKREEIINFLMWSIAKNYPDSAKEFDRTIDYINATINAVKNLDRSSSRFQIEEGVIAQVRQAPLGIVLCMGPSNYPINESFCLLIPALIMGNTVVFRPPHLGVPIIAPLLEAFRDSFPPGVINIIFGSSREIISPLLGSGEVDVFSFIGSSKTAKALKKLHPEPQRLRAITGMDANNCAIIFEDADLDSTVEECLLGTLSYNGQRCTALKVLFVHKKIIEEFVSKFSHAVENLPFGLPWQENVKITPMPELEKTNYLNSLIEDAQRKGAIITNPSGGKTNQTFFFPAVLYPVTADMRVLNEEQFGPIIPIIPFDNETDPLKTVVKSNFGQQLSIFTTNPDKIANILDPLVNQVCRININSQCQRGPDIFPFTGRRNSAEGVLSVTEALEAFSIPVMVSAKQNSLNQKILKNITQNHKSNFLSTDFIF